MCRVDRGSRYKSRHMHDDSDSSLEVEENDYNTSKDHSDPQFRAYLDYLRKNEIFLDEVDLEMYGLDEEETERSPERIKKEKKETVAVCKKKDSRKSLKNVQMKDRSEKPGDSSNVQREGKRGKRVKVESQDADMDETFVEDICFRHFLNNKYVKGDCAVYIYGGKRVMYEEDDDHSNDVELSSDAEVTERGEMGINPSETPSNASSTDGDDVEWIPNPDSFRENLIRQLKRCYDQQEYEHLLERVNQKIPRSGEKRTSKGNAKDGLSKSYLETYKVLEARLLANRFERPKKLNILRGFFYWLLNERQNGAFRPWEDPVCLAVMPGSK